MLYPTSTDFINKEDGSLNIDAVTQYVAAYMDSDPTRQQIRLPIDSTSLAVLRKSLGVVNNLTPEGGVIVGTNSLVNGVVSGYLKSDNYAPGVSGWKILGDGTVEFASGYFRGDITGATGTFSGALVGGTLSIPNITTANSFHVDTDGNSWWGTNLATGYATAPAYVLKTGSAKFTLGTIGGWTIGATSLTGVGVTLSSTGDAYKAVGATPPISSTVGTGVFIDKTGIYGLSANTQNFKLDATNGHLTAIAGTIGGFTLGATEMYGGIIKTSANVAAGYNGVIMDTDGVRGYHSVLGVVFNLHTDGSAPEFAFGNISESIFEVSTNALIRTSSTVGDGSANSAGILINETGIFGCGANQTPSSANFRILIDGGGSITLGTSGFVRAGQTDFATGTGFFLGYSTNNYKFSIGVSDNYMNWDGSYLKVKGSFTVGNNGVVNNASYTVGNLPAVPTSVGYNNPSGIN